MADDDQDSWLGGVGLDVGAIRQSISNAVGLGSDDNANQNDASNTNGNGDNSDQTNATQSNGTSPNGAGSAPNVSTSSFNLTPPQLTIPGQQAPNPAGD